MQESNDQPAQFLVENVSLLPPGRVLDIAMGSGRNAVYLAKLGFEVDGVDISGEAIAEALKLAQNNRVQIQAQVTDLEKNYHLPVNNYEVIICFNYLQRSLTPEIKSALKQGGMVVFETYIVDQVQFGRPRNPNFLLKYNELLEMFRDFRCLRYREGIIENRKAVAGIIAQKG